MQRRVLLQALAATALAGPRAVLCAVPGEAARQKLLVVMLRGAYDGLSLLAPHASSFYYEVRPNLALRRPDPANPDALTDLGGGWGLHPAVRGALLPLWQARQLAFVPFCGSADATRSHFEAQDRMEMGQDPAARPDYGSGYLNRLLQVLGAGPGGICFTGNLALALKGPVAVPNIALQDGGPRAPDAGQASAIAAMYHGRNLGGLVEEGFDTQARLAQEMDPQAGRGARGARGFEAVARRVAVALRDERYAIGFVDVGGWDSHQNQGAASGQLAGNLAGLAAGLATLASELGPVWNSTTVVVMSEFGRTVRENGTRGTDHGHGNTLWVLGGSLAGGRVAGRQQELSAATLYQGRDLPVLNDYRGVLGEILRRRYGLSRGQLERVLPGAVPAETGIA